MTIDDDTIRALSLHADHLEVRETDLSRLGDQLATTAARVGLLDVAYRILDTPIGPLLVAATPTGLVRVAFDSEGEAAVLEELATKVSPRVLRAPQRLDGVARQLEEYFDGARRRFEVPLDLSLSSGFRRDVLIHLSTIAFGRTESYGEVAAAIHNPRAVRAVGTACATNPIPVVIPCHRVVRSDGQFGAYRGGAAMKAQLLQMEAVA